MTLLQRKNFLLAIACALIALLTIAACGGDDDDLSGNDPAATEESDDGDGGDDETAEPTEDDGGDDGGDEDTPEPTEDDGDRGDPPVDVCDLLTTDEAERTLGDPVDDPAPDNSDPYFSCTWETENFDDVTIEIFAESEQERESYYSATFEPEEISGMGNKAQYTDLIGLEVMTDNYVVTVTIFDFDLDEDEKRDLTLGLGERVLGRLDD